MLISYHLNQKFHLLSMWETVVFFNKYMFLTHGSFSRLFDE